MSKKFHVEEFVGLDENTAEWLGDEELVFDDLKEAKVYAKSLIRPTEHGESGVRVISLEPNGNVITHWSNTEPQDHPIWYVFSVFIAFVFSVWMFTFTVLD